MNRKKARSLFLASGVNTSFAVLVYGHASLRGAALLTFVSSAAAAGLTPGALSFFEAGRFI